MTMSRLDILLRKIDTMQSALGIKGASKPPPKKKNLTEFEQALLFARNKLKETNDKIDERQNKIGLFGPKSKEIIKYEIDIRDLITQTKQAIKDLDHALKPLRKERIKHPNREEELKQKEKLVLLIKDQLAASEAEFEGMPIQKQSKDPNKGILTRKEELMGGRHDERCLTTEEQEALDRFRRRDEQIDDMLVLVIQDIDLLKEKATHINNAIDRNEEKLHATEKQASKTMAKLETINTKMKDILRKYAEPSRMCLYVILLMVALGLLMILYNQSKSL